MRLFLALAALLFAFCSPGAAQTSDWSIGALEGDARGFVMGAWKPLHAGEPLARNHVVETLGRLRVASGGDLLDFAPGSKLQLEGESYALVRLIQGAVEATVEAKPGRPFMVMTTFAQVATSGAAFSVVTQAYGATVVVRDGSVSVTDLTDRTTVEVKQGETLHLRAGRGAAPVATGVPISATPADLKAAAPAPAPVDPELANKILSLDHLSTGAIRPLTKAEAQMTDDAVEKLRQEKRKLNLAKPDPRAVAAVQAIERELLTGFQYEPEPWEDNFRWTEVEDGEVKLKPLWKVFARLEAPEAYEFWLLVCTSCLLLGLLATAITAKSGFGVLGSTTLVALGFALAILARDLWFRGGANVGIEPYLTLCMMLATMTAFLLGGVSVRHRFA